MWVTRARRDPEHSRYGSHQFESMGPVLGVGEPNGTVWSVGEVHRRLGFAFESARDSDYMGVQVPFSPAVSATPWVELRRRIAMHSSANASALRWYERAAHPR